MDLGPLVLFVPRDFPNAHAENENARASGGRSVSIGQYPNIRHFQGVCHVTFSSDLSR